MFDYLKPQNLNAMSGYYDRAAVFESLIHFARLNANHIEMNEYFISIPEEIIRMRDKKENMDGAEVLLRIAQIDAYNYIRFNRDFNTLFECTDIKRLAAFLIGADDYKESLFTWNIETQENGDRVIIFPPDEYFIEKEIRINIGRAAGTYDYFVGPVATYHGRELPEECRNVLSSFVMHADYNDYSKE